MERIKNSSLLPEEKQKAIALVAGGKLLLSSFDGVSDEDVLIMLNAAIQLHAGFFQPQQSGEWIPFLSRVDITE